MKWRKKPVVVEATQWMKHGDHPAVMPFKDKYGRPLDNDETGWVDTPEGLFVVFPGDYLVTDADGKHCSYSADVFFATYEPVDE